MIHFEAYNDLDANTLERRRRELGMSRAELAARSGVSLPTVTRILRGSIKRASLMNIEAIAMAMGARLTIHFEENSLAFREREAARKAEKIVRNVQSTSSLEQQAVNVDLYEEMLGQTVHEIMAGSKRRLWSKT
jgi:transcriptional regulator with XRE-family HTH domain